MLGRRLLRMAQEAGIDPGIAKRQRLAIDAHRAVLQGPHQFLGGVHQREQVAAMVPAMHIGRRDEDLKRRVARPCAHTGEARVDADRSEEHTSELQSLMRISYAVFCLKKKTKPK